MQWRGLEVAAFEFHPEVIELLDTKEKYAHMYAAYRRKRRLKLVWLLPLGIVFIALKSVGPFMGTIAAAAPYGSERYGKIHLEPATAIHISGMIFAAYLVVVLAPSIGMRLVNERRKKPDKVDWLDVPFALGFGGASAAITAVVGVMNEVPAWQLWWIPIIVTVVLGGVYGLVLGAANRAYLARNPGDVKKERVSADNAAAAKRFRRVRERIERLDVSERTAVKQDIDAAIRDLVSREVVSAADGDWALRAELGKLAVHMSQRRTPAH